MKLLKITTWMAIGALAALTAGAAVAAPFAMYGGLDAARGSAVTKVHQGCHFDNRYHPRYGMHNHSNAECRPEAARPREPDFGYQRGGEYYGEGRGHPCHFDCRFSPGLGWHNHSNAQCRAEPCRAR